MSSDSEQIIKFQSKQGDVVEIDRKSAEQSLLIKGLLQNVPTSDNKDEPIRIEVNTDPLKKVFDWCKNHKDDAPPSDEQAIEKDSTEEKELNHSDKQLIKLFKDDPMAVVPLILAANFMQVSGMEDMLVNATADMMKGKTPEQVRLMFKIENDFSDKEKDQIERETAWCNDS